MPVSKWQGSIVMRHSFVWILLSVCTTCVTWLPAADEAAPPGDDLAPLLASAREGDVSERAAAIARLAERGEQARPAIGLLREALQEEQPQIQAAAAAALGKLALEPDTVLPELVKLFDQTEPTPAGPLCYIAAEAVGRFGEPAVPHVIRALRHEEPQVRCSAAVSVCVLGATAKPVLPTLIELIPDSDLDTRRPFLMSALLCLGAEAKPAIPLLLELLEDEDFHTQYWACRVLGRIGPEAKVAVPPLMRLVAGGVTSVRRNAAAALGDIGPVVGPEAVQVLIQALNDPIQPVREQAVIALGKLGDLAKPAVPAIEQVLAEGSTFAARSQAAKSLWRLDPTSKTPLRVLLVQIQDPNEPWVAAEVLGEFGPAMGAVEQVAELLNSPDAETRLYAAVALGQMGRAAADETAALERLLEDPERDVRDTAREALEEIRKAGANR